VSKRKLNKSKSLIKRLEGGMAKQLPGGAVEFSGRTHEQGGIILPNSFFGEKETGGPLTEVEDKETMDKVNGEDYFFSSHLTLGDKSFAERHKQLLYAGASQQAVEELARIQEIVAGRDKYELGGERMHYRHGGEHTTPYYTTSHDPDGARGDSVVYYYIDPDEPGLNNRTFATKADMEKHMKEAAQKKRGTDSVVHYYPHRAESPSAPLTPSQEDEQGDFVPADVDLSGGLGYNYNTGEPSDATQSDPNAGNIFEDGVSTLNGQKGLKYGDRTIYLTDSDLIAQIEELGGLDNFMDAWWESADKSVLEDAGIESIDDLFNNPSTDSEGRVVYPGWQAYQTSYNKVVAGDDADKQILVDGLPGNQSFSSGFESPVEEVVTSNVVEDEVVVDDEQYVPVSEDLGYIPDYTDLYGPPANDWVAYNAGLPTTFSRDYLDDERYDDDYISTDKGTITMDPEGENLTKLDTEFNPYINPNETVKTTPGGTSWNMPKKFPNESGPGWQSAVAAGLQLLPAYMAYKDKPDYMGVPGRIPAIHMPRVRYNDALAENASNYRGMSRFLEQSGLGVGAISNRMAAWQRKQEGDVKIEAQQARENIGISTKEVQANLDRKKFNIKNRMYVDEFNRAADAATKDRKLMAVQNAVQSLASMNRDRMMYKAENRKARALEGPTGVMNRFNQEYAFRNANPHLVPGTAEYNDSLNEMYMTIADPKAAEQNEMLQANLEKNQWLRNQYDALFPNRMMGGKRNRLTRKKIIYG
jgi:hypothetical protein